MAWRYLKFFPTRRQAGGLRRREDHYTSSHICRKQARFVSLPPHRWSSLAFGRACCAGHDGRQAWVGRDQIKVQTGEKDLGVVGNIITGQIGPLASHPSEGFLLSEPSHALFFNQNMPGFAVVK